MNSIKLTYCKRCIMPETKPDLYIDPEGICSACRSFENRREVDWQERKDELLEVLDKYRSKNGENYDCIIPVSGGKDSTYQTIKMLEFGMNPLCVTATTDHLSEIGRRNIENIKSLGVDYLELTVNPVIRRKVNRIALEQIGDISWPEHVLIFTIPVRISVQLNIPLIIWGENSQNEYGGPAAAAQNNTLTREWLEEFGGLLGLRVSDLPAFSEVKNHHLIQYTYPSNEDLQKTRTTGLFLGHFLPWDGYQNALIAQANGFETYHKPVEGSLVNYENLDNCQTGIHDYFKFLKFGFGRCTDLACLHVRRKRLSRDAAITIAKKLDGNFPWEYLGVPIEKILGEIDLSVDEFIKICDRFTNRKIFLCTLENTLIKDKNGNLTKVNYDNEPEGITEKSA